MYLKDNGLTNYRGIVLLIDEFTHLYNLLKSNEVEASLLGSFKYIIETNDLEENK